MLARAQSEMARFRYYFTDHFCCEFIDRGISLFVNPMYGLIKERYILLPEYEVVFSYLYLKKYIHKLPV